MSDAPVTPVRRTAFARAVKAVEQQLQSACVSPHIFRNRARVVPKDMPTAVVVRMRTARSEAAAGVSTWTVWNSALDVEMYARARVGMDVEDAMDELLARVSDALLADPSLGGVVGGLQLAAVDWDYDVDGEKTACATASFVVRHAAGAANLT